MGKEWSIWVLSKGDIEECAESVGLNPDKFTKGDFEQVAGLFKKGFLCGVEDWWSDVLADAIKKVKG